MSARWGLAGASGGALRGLAAAAFGLTVVTSYALQRLGAAWVGEPSYAGIVAQEHVPLYWRIAMATFHGVLVAAVIAAGLDESAAERWLERVPWLVAAVVGPAALAMLAVP